MHAVTVSQCMFKSACILTILCPSCIHYYILIACYSFSVIYLLVQTELSSLAALTAEAVV